MESLRETYKGSINLVSDENNWDILENVKQEVIHALVYASKPGRPNKQRMPSIGERSWKTINCENCGKPGHNKKNCRHAPFFQKNQIETKLKPSLPKVRQIKSLKEFYLSILM